MTTTQTQVLEQITELMREHFDGAVFIFETDARQDDDPTLCHLSYRCAGTFAQALGLVDYARHKMLNHDDEG